MKDHFDRINEYFDLFSADTELTALLGTTPTDVDSLDTIIKRGFRDVSVIDPESLPMMDMGFVPNNGLTGNHLVNRDLVEINLYAVNFYEAGRLYKEVHRILNENFEDCQVISPYDRGIPVGGVFCWSFRVKTFVKS